MNVEDPQQLDDPRNTSLPPWTEAVVVSVPQSPACDRAETATALITDPSGTTGALEGEPERAEGPAMLIAEARVRTDRPSWYLERLCEPPGHVGSRILHILRLLHGGTPSPRIRHVERTDSHGTINVDMGRCTLHLGSDSLTLRVEATDQDSLQSIQHLITGSLRKIGRRDALPHVIWQQTGAAAQPPDDSAPMDRVVPRPRRTATLGVIAVVALVVTVHLGLGGLLLASGPWKHWAIGAVLTVILLRVAYVLGRLGRRKRGRNTS
ncbi:DUF2218 domain-containing protein [Streptomyces sp. NPDC059582]|uniref:DUF2218 domain-containing protein n=1 Tax=Streptomyces sp. NPDC059582 TaxID=3346875 RepID=UPI0036B237D0